MQVNSMAKEDKRSEIIEHGDLFFFYRPKIDALQVKDIDDVARFYLVTASEASRHPVLRRKNLK